MKTLMVNVGGVQVFLGTEEPRRADSWNHLQQLDDCPNVPWLIFGDFNEIAFFFEK